MKINEVIKSVGNNKYRLYSKKGKNLGTFDSKNAAEKHEREVQYFKHANEDYEWEKEEGYDFENPLPIITSTDVWSDVEDLEGDIIEAWEEKTGKSWRGTYGGVAGYKQFWEQVGTVEDVPINKIVCTEKWLKKDQIDAIMSGTAKSSSSLPLIHVVNNTYVATDGNHRIVATALAGKQSIKCNVLHSPDTVNKRL